MNAIFFKLLKNLQINLNLKNVYYVTLFQENEM